MKLFSSTQISWNEPLFFLMRIREGWSWRRRLFLALGISAVMFLAIFFFGLGRLGLAGQIGISLASGFLLVALLDLGNIQREVTVKEDCIIVNSAVGQGWFETFQLKDIHAVRLMRPDEWGKAYGGMVIGTAKDNFLVAVPRKVSLATLANILHRLGVAVYLSEWEPSDSDTRIGVRNQIDLDPAAVRGEINIRPVGEHDGKLLGPGHVAVQVVIALGPLLLALAGVVVAAVVLILNWSAMSILDRCLYAGGSLAGLVVAFIYLVKVGQFVANAYGLRVARNRLQGRPNAIFTGKEDDLVGVEIFERESWTSVISRSSDFGFLRIDRRLGKLSFEGNRFRWTLPASALTACRIEESIVGSEANPNPEKRYFVVIEAVNKGEPWEAGMVYTRTEVGSDTPDSRYNRAQLLFTQIADAVGRPSGDTSNPTPSE